MRVNWDWGSAASLSCIMKAGLILLLATASAGKVTSRPVVPELKTLASPDASGPADNYNSATASVSATTIKGPVVDGITLKGSDRDIAVTSKSVDGKIEDYMHLKTGQSSLETVMVWTTAGELWYTQDMGGQWTLDPNVRNAFQVIAHPRDQNLVFAITRSGELFVSRDRGATPFNQLPTPGRFSDSTPSVLAFHPSSPYIMIFHGQVCSDNNPFDCKAMAYKTLNSGQSWQPLGENLVKCMFVDKLQQPTPSDLVYCEKASSRGSSGTKELVYTTDWGQHWTTAFENVHGMGVEEPFLLAVTEKENRGVGAMISVNGVSWAEARFPENLALDPRLGYTVLNSKTKSMFLFASTFSEVDQEFGVLMKSNNNGTNFVVNLDNVNRDNTGFIDYDRVKSVDGVSLANVVANPDEVRVGDRKIVQTRITHSDGAFWDYLPPPSGMCGPHEALERCALHLHGYTERKDVRNSPTSTYAVGLIVGHGNVGDHLENAAEASTFISRDAGITWKKVADEPLLWEFGDSGSIVVGVDRDEPTSTLYYSLDEGDSWETLEFSADKLLVTGLTSTLADTSRKFLITASTPPRLGSNSLLIEIDFTNKLKKECSAKDYVWWAPEHPQIGSCLFGREALYHRKIQGTLCYVGVPSALDRPIESDSPCDCTPSDYECDYNYERDRNGECRLAVVNGVTLKPLTKEEQCADGAIAWHRMTGYRKIAMSMCVNGEQKGSPDQPCPGKEKEFKEWYGSSEPQKSNIIVRFIRFIASLVFFVVIVAAIFGGGWYIYTRYAGSTTGGLSLGDDGDEYYSGSTAQRSLQRVSVMAENGLEVLRTAWNALYVRFLSRSPRDHMGFYARMDDEERYRILESEFEDEYEAAGSDTASLHADHESPAIQHDQEVEDGGQLIDSDSPH